MKPERQISTMLGFAIKEPIRQNFWALITNFMGGILISTEDEILYHVIGIVKKGVDHEA